MKEKITYVAYDGTEFNRITDCHCYEEKNLSINFDRLCKVFMNPFYDSSDESVCVCNMKNNEYFKLVSEYLLNKYDCEHMAEPKSYPSKVVITLHYDWCSWMPASEAENYILKILKEL